jgi:hypothetical protein
MPAKNKFNDPWLDRLRGLTMGLAMSNHVTTLLLVPPALILGVVPGDEDRNNTPHIVQFWSRGLKYSAVSLRRQLNWFGIGLAFYLILPLRAMTNPPVNWGNPVTLERFWWLVSGQLYQSYYLQLGLAHGWGNVQAWAALILQQFGMVGLVFGCIGLTLFFTPSRLYALTIWISIVYSAFALLYTSDDSYLYLIPVYLVFAIWIGLGAGNLMSHFALIANPVRLGMGILLIGYFIFHSLGFIDQVDASHDRRAETFGREVLSAAPQDAIIFARGDQAIFTLWYFHFALGERRDVSVIASDLLHFDWYQENLRSVYPSLDVPDPFPWPETITSANPLRAVCYVQYIDRTEMDCVEPLMAP